MSQGIQANKGRLQPCWKTLDEQCVMETDTLAYHVTVQLTTVEKYYSASPWLLLPIILSKTD
jgi:hypothetical protein